jgi:aspartate-semialdehyde dehydrogenase
MLFLYLNFKLNIMNIAIVGVTGLVGNVMQEVLKERNFPIDKLIPVASSKSVGKKINFGGTTFSVVDNEMAINSEDIDIALFSAGGSTSLEWAPKYAEKGIYVIDNSSAWRMDPNKVLCVPEINAHLLGKDTKIIANPNCSTIQMVAALSEIHKAYKIKRLVISTYQSFTGTGKKAVDQYNSEKAGNAYDAATAAYQHPIFENCIPHCDVFYENGYTKEELKLVNETRKILGDDNIKITATAVRVPVFGGHSESVNVEFENAFDINELKDIMRKTSGVIIQDDPKNNVYPLPLQAHGKDEVFVGRLRRDDSIENGLNMWIVSDNLRKGAATNAVQIAEHLISNVL